MYTIVKKLDGKFLCIGQIQDGNEQWEEPSLEDAVQSLKKFAKTMNGARGADKLKRKHIKYLQERHISRIECVPWEPK